ncbi:hypothetical protein I4100191B2_11850 [Clostridiales bacterium]
MNEGSSRVAKPHPLPWGSALLSWQRAMKGAYFYVQDYKKIVLYRTSGCGLCSFKHDIYN